MNTVERTQLNLSQKLKQLPPFVGTNKQNI